MSLSLTLKRALFAVLLVAALLVVLAGGIIRGTASHTAIPGHSSLHSTSQQLASYCPAPPVIC
jgi:hypothetical protein